MPPPFDLQGHRGARGLAPENTAPSFAAALALGVDTIETDLLVTSDDVVVLCHDPRLNPAITRGPDHRWLSGPGPAVRSLTFAELQRFDVGRIDPASDYARRFPRQVPVDGARIPTLAQLFALGEARAQPPRYNLELKLSPLEPALTPDPDTFVRLVLAEVRRASLGARAALQSFDWRVMLAARRQAPDIATNALTVDISEESNLRRPAGGASPWLAGLDAAHPGAPISAVVPELVHAAGCGTWCPFWRNLDAEGLARAHRLGLRVVPWTVNEPADLVSVIELGVDGLITDDPDRALEVLARLGRR